MTFWKAHIAYMVVFSALGFAGLQWLKEHDARLLAEQQTKISQTEIASLKDQILARDQQAQKQVQVIVKQQAATVTPQQAVQAIPDVSTLPVNIRPLPNSGDFVLAQADLVPLYNQLAEGKKCAIELTACQKDFADGKVIVAQQETEIQAWKKAAGHHNFFGKIWQGTQKVGLLAIGIAVGKVI